MGLKKSGYYFKDIKSKSVWLAISPTHGEKWKLCVKLDIDNAGKRQAYSKDLD